MKDLSFQVKREVEADLREAYTRLFKVKEATGLTISMMCVSDNPEHTCIFLHDNEEKKILAIQKVAKIDGCLDNGEWSLIPVNSEEKLHEEEED